MTKLTTKAFAVLSTLDVYKEACKKTDEKKKARITTVQYEAVDARVPQVKEGRPAQGSLRMKRRQKTVHEELGIQAQLIKRELEERAYLQWVEARSTRRALEEAWEKQFSLATLKEAEQMLIQASEVLAEGVAGLRIRKYPNPTTWVQDLYSK